MAKLTTDEIIDALKEMTLLEASELVKAIEDTFGVSAAAPAAVVAAPAAGAAASAHGVPKTAGSHAEGSEGTDELFRLTRVPAVVFLNIAVCRAGKWHQLFR